MCEFLVTSRYAHARHPAVAAAAAADAYPLRAASQNSGKKAQTSSVTAVRGMLMAR